MCRMKILIDNGHGSNTSGKCSPDGRLKEYAYTREIAIRLEAELRKKGIDAERIVKEEIDVPLSSVAVGRTNTRQVTQSSYLSTVMQREAALNGCRHVVGKRGLRQVRRKPIN